MGFGRGDGRHSGRRRRSVAQSLKGDGVATSATSRNESKTHAESRLNHPENIFMSQRFWNLLTVFHLHVWSEINSNFSINAEVGKRTRRLWTQPVAAISSEWWGDGGLGAEPPAEPRGRALVRGSGLTKMLGGRVPRPPYNRRPWTQHTLLIHNTPSFVCSQTTWNTEK